MTRVQRIVWATVGLCLVVGLGLAVGQWWVCDDAFISFRYAKNLVDGHGLSFNPVLAAEVGPVEGYTNFLWTILVALGLSLGFEPVGFANVLSLLFHAGTVFLLLRSAGRGSSGVVVPVAAGGYALHYHAAQFATGGLETAMNVFLVTAGALVLIRAERVIAFALAGLLWILATMTRPDSALFYAIGSVVVLLVCRRTRTALPLLGFAVPFLLVYVPYYAWRYSYYGYPFPNTFYAKSASDPYIGQGLLYAGVYFHVYLAAATGLVALFFLLRRSGAMAVERPGLGGPRAPLLLGALILVFGVYVVWVGGDFMFARFWLPITSLLYLALQIACNEIRYRQVTRMAGAAIAFVLISSLVFWGKDLSTPWFASHGLWASLAVALAMALAAVLHRREAPHATGLGLGLLVLSLSASSYTVLHSIHDYSHSEKWKISEERSWYEDWFVARSRSVGEQIAAKTAGLDVRALVGGQQVMFGYYANLAVVMELHGLTDKVIAHRQITKRGKVGHEKQVAIADPYLKQQRIHFILATGLGDHLNFQGDPVGRYRHVEFGPGPFGGSPPGFVPKLTLLRYDRKLMAELRRRGGFRIPDFESYLDEYLRKMRSLPKEQVQFDYAAFRDFYFDFSPDPRREQAFESYLR